MQCSRGSKRGDGGSRLPRAELHTGPHQIPAPKPASTSKAALRTEHLPAVGKTLAKPRSGVPRREAARDSHPDGISPFCAQYKHYGPCTCLSTLSNFFFLHSVLLSPFVPSFDSRYISPPARTCIFHVGKHLGYARVVVSARSKQQPKNNLPPTTASASFLNRTSLNISTPPTPSSLFSPFLTSSEQSLPFFLTSESSPTPYIKSAFNCSVDLRVPLTTRSSFNTRYRPLISGPRIPTSHHPANSNLMSFNNHSIQTAFFCL